MESRVKQSLSLLLQSHVSNFTQEDIDDIVLSYVMGILEDLVEETYPEQSWDCDSFMEMLVAYLPQSEGIEEEKMTQWILKLTEEIKNDKKAKTASKFDIKMIIEETANKQVTKKSRSVSETSEPENYKKRAGRLSETSENGSSDEAELEAGVATLLEMFPACYKVEAVHCLTIMGGDMQRAAQMILTRAEMGEDIKLSQQQLLAQLSRPVKIDETEVKKKIMNSYGFVDTEVDQKYHRPSLRKGDDKKMIRYRDGKIVSTKGERFSQVTKEESEEMKKTIVNILL
eukprot:GFUD01001930.1.p1 GENE.GFUD01001930.1~~GFUD01001930.1.p1  ORF type:complete len:286 (-),score=87.18 GFUD01001930.1:186-1043(-)